MEGLRGVEVVGCGMGGLRFRLVACEATREAVEQDLARHTRGVCLALGGYLHLPLPVVPWFDCCVYMGPGGPKL